MAHEVVMPQLGLSMEAGRIVAWLKQSGDFVRPGDGLFEVESDKANIEVVAVASGVLQIVEMAGPPALRVGSVIGYLLAAGETLAADQPTPSHTAVAQTPPAPASAPPLTITPSVAPRLPSSPAARRRAREAGLDWTLAAGSGPNGRIRERDILRMAAAQPPAVVPQPRPAPAITISPVARQLAQRLGMDLDALAALYPDQRIERDAPPLVEAAVRQMIQMRGVPAAQQDSGPAVEPAFERRPLSSMRRMIAERMAHSAHTAAAVTLHTEADATEIVRLRASWPRDASAAALSYNAILAKIVAVALLEHRELNVTFDSGGNGGGDETLLWNTVHMGMAVDTPRGLVAPVVRHVETLSLRALASILDELLPRAQAGKAMPDELTGGTFTLTNLGAYGVDTFTPIIAPPQAAILGIGRLLRKPVVVADDRIEARTRLSLSLTFDHRLVDGAPAARFLARVTQLIELPYLWLA